MKYVILENHMHFIAQSDHPERDMVRFKSYTAKNLIRFFLRKKDKNDALLISLRPRIDILFKFKEDTTRYKNKV